MIAAEFNAYFCSAFSIATLILVSGLHQLKAVFFKICNGISSIIPCHKTLFSWPRSLFWVNVSACQLYFRDGVMLTDVKLDSVCNLAHGKVWFRLALLLWITECSINQLAWTRVKRSEGEGPIETQSEGLIEEPKHLKATLFPRFKTRFTWHLRCRVQRYKHSILRWTSRWTCPTLLFTNINKAMSG